MTYDDYENFYGYVMKCVDLKAPNDILFSVENLCASCRNRQDNDYCDFWSSIKQAAHDDKGNDIVCSCSAYEDEADIPF